MFPIASSPISLADPLRGTPQGDDFADAAAVALAPESGTST